MTDPTGALTKKVFSMFNLFQKKSALFCFSLALVAFPFYAQAQENAHPEEDSLTLQWPLNCTVYKDCFIKYYPDLRVGTDPAKPIDYKCGQRTRPGHAGTSIVYKDYTTTRNQTVLAMAPGRVMFIRDDFSDNRRYGEKSAHACGNYVQIRHSNIFSSKYCHLGKSSINVEIGEKVEAGAELALVGSSGAAGQPKLYVQLLKNNQPIDPFTSRMLSRPSECFSRADKQMWAEHIPYPKAGVMEASFAMGVPTINALNFEAPVIETLPASLPNLSVWVRVFGIKKGDKEEIIIKTPQGEVWHKNERRHSTSANFWTAFLTAKPSASLEKGVWQGVYTLNREGESILEHTFEVHVTD